jgi:hypothetical protein
LLADIRIPRLVLAAVCAAVLCGCGDTPPSTSLAPPATQAVATATPTPQLIVETANLPADAAALRITAASADGTTVFGPTVIARAPQVSLSGIPQSAQTVEVEVLPSLDGGAPVGDYVTSPDLAQGPVILRDPPFVDPRAPVVSRFVAMGCNRLNYGDRKLTPSSANAAQLIADFQEVATRYAPVPSHFFFTGDLVMNEDVGTATLDSQLTEWKQLYASSALPGSACRLVALPGNHEMLIYDTTINDEIPNPPTGPVWSSRMADFIPASDGPTQAPPNLDGVQRDESRLSFSFKVGDTLFIALDTETWEGGLTPASTGRIPLHWIAEKLAAGQSDPEVRQIFVLGHKPINSTATDGELLTIAPDQGPAFYAMLNGASKVRAYICAHVHAWDYGTPPGSSGRVPQLIAGNGGSSVDTSFLPPIGYYGYTVVSITSAGQIVAESWGRPIPTPYSAQTPQPPSTIRERFRIY